MEVSKPRGTKLTLDATGRGNVVQIGNGGWLDNPTIRIRGNNCKIVIGDNCHIGPGCSFWMEGDDMSIVIGSHTSFTHSVHFCAQEAGRRIEVGEDCMFSFHIVVRTSDSHPIYDETGARLNPAADVAVGKHVWIAPNTKIMKGASIGEGCIVGSDTTVTKPVPASSLAVGRPARIARSGVRWTRESLF